MDPALLSTGESFSCRHELTVEIPALKRDEDRFVLGLGFDDRFFNISDDRRRQIKPHAAAIDQVHECAHKQPTDPCDRNIGVKIGHGHKRKPSP